MVEEGEEEPQAEQQAEIETFEKGESGSSHTYPVQAGSLKKGSYAMLNGFPCRVVEMSSSKTGKHGHAKATIVGIDIFTHKKHEDSAPSSHSIDAPFVTRKEYQLADITSDGFVSCLLENGETKEDLKLPTEEDDQKMVEKLRETFESGKTIIIGVMSAMGIEKIVDFKELS